MWCTCLHVLLVLNAVLFLTCKERLSLAQGALDFSGIIQYDINYYLFSTLHTWGRGAHNSSTHVLQE